MKDTKQNQIDINKNGTVNGTVNEIVKAISNNSSISIDIIANQVGKSRRTVIRIINDMKERGILRRIGSDKTGYWEIMKGNKSKDN